MHLNSDMEIKRDEMNVSEDIPFNFSYDQKELKGACENIIGYIPIPLGYAGPLVIDRSEATIPLATTEGALVASINRGCKLLRQNGGVTTVQNDDGMTRGPVLQFPDIQEAFACYQWINSPDGFRFLKSAFDATSRFARLDKAVCKQASSYVFVRLKSSTGDAMGMNMVGKGAESAMAVVLEKFPSGDLLSLSGNYCTDKKASALNWIEGRGKSVIAEAFIDPKSIEDILHCSPERLLVVHKSKCMIGASLSGSIGGNNAHAANVVAAIFIATGQDLAQIADSSFCLTDLEIMSDGRIHATVTMPCIQVGCIGGGTRLPPQKAALNMLKGLEGDASRTARVLAAAVLAGELSLLGSLAEGSLMKAHLRLNRQ